MAQLESEANLARLADPRMRLLVEILIRTGLRIGDATRLRIDCLVRDQQRAAMTLAELAWVNSLIDDSHAGTLSWTQVQMRRLAAEAHE